MTQFERLVELINKLGGQFYHVPKYIYDKIKNADTFNPAPYAPECLGIDWDEKIIICMNDHFETGDIIHEAGHIFATDKHPDSSGLKEIDFFGWEYAVAKYIKLPFVDWTENQQNYIISYVGNPDKSKQLDCEFGALSNKRQRQLVMEHVHNARKLGILDGWTPKSVRT